MPKQSQLAVTHLPPDETHQKLEQLGVFARPVATAVPGNPQSDLEGLLDGLKAFNPALEKYATAHDQMDADTARQAGTIAQETAQRDPANVLALPESMPEYVNPAFRGAFDSAYKKALGNRLGIESSTSIAAEYEKQKLTDGFDAKSWLHQQFQSTAGIQDPEVAAEITQHHVALSRHILAEDNRVKLQQLEQATTANDTAAMNAIISSAQNDPAKLAEGIHKFMAGGAWQQYNTRPEMASKWVEMVAAASIADKGSPKLFDALDKFKDPMLGRTMAETNPGMVLKIEQARRAAQAQFDQKIEQASQVVNFQTMAQVEDGLAKGSTAYDDNWIAANTGGPGKLFTSTEAALAFRKKRDTALAIKDDLGYTLGLMKEGLGYLATPELQKKAADYVTTPLVNEIIQIANDPSKQPLLAERMAAFAQVHADSKLSIGNEVLTRFINSMAALPPSKDGKPSPQFLSAAAMYQTMPPNVRDLYFKDDAKKLFDHYTKEVNAATTPESAYQMAYAGISPEAKQREQELAKDPAWAANTQKVISSAVDGLKYQPTRDFVPFRDNLPSNLDLLTKGAGVLEAKRWMTAHPNMGEADLKDYMQGWVQRNYVHDTNTNMLVGVPAGVGQAGSKPVSWFQEGLIKMYGAASRPTLVYMGNNQYQVQLLATNSVKETTDWDRMWEQYKTATRLTDQDRAIMADLQKKGLDGSLSADIVLANAPILSKLRSLGLLHRTVGEFDRAMDRALITALEAPPKMSIGSSATAVGRLPNPANDVQSQKASTLSFLRDGSVPSLAAALITQGEGVVLRASPDPAKGAGMNIGMGYNLNANAATLKDDFRKAGIPVEAVEDIKSGAKSITSAQAERLLILSIPRYLETAQKTIDKKHPGLWNKMTPQQKAVVTDVAYQVKDLSKFGESIDALFSGDQERIDKAFKVHFTDQKGNTVPDNRRNSLRANLLKSPAIFQAVALHN